LVHLPPPSAIIPEDETEDVQVALDPVKDLPNWYKFKQTTGKVFAWIEGDGERWWESWGSAKLNVGAEPPEASSGFIFCIAEVDADSYLPHQYVAGQVIFAPRMPDTVSVEVQEVKGSAVWQLRGFDDLDDITSKGLSEVIKADPDTGEIEAMSDSYDLVVRIRDASGQRVGYMPLDVGDGGDDGTGRGGECAHTTAPDGSDGGGGLGFGSDRGSPDSLGGGGGNARDMTIHPNRVLPGKTGPCW